MTDTVSPEHASHSFQFRGINWREHLAVEADYTSEPPLFITLVHGTWPRGLFSFFKLSPFWFETGSRFRKDITGHLALWYIRNRGVYVRRDLEFVELKWSGANSVFAREAAAKKLAEELKRQSNISPEADRVVIAHSHGGNVALRALRMDFGQSDKPIKLTTLATPFLDIREAPPLERVSLTHTAIFFALSFLVSSFVLGKFLFSNAILGAEAGFAMLGLIAIAWLPLTALRDYFLRSDLRAWQIAKAARSVDDLARTAEVQVLRGIDDEAALSLAIGSAVTRFANLLVSRLPQYATGILICAWSLLLPSVFGESKESPEAFQNWQISLWLYLSYVLTLISCFACVGLMASPFAKSIFARELFWNSKRFDISVNSAPDVRGSIYIRTIEESILTREKLRHGLYEVPACKGFILSWLVRDESAAEWFQDLEQELRAMERWTPEAEPLTIDYDWSPFGWLFNPWMWVRGDDNSENSVMTQWDKLLARATKQVFGK
jgi:hypothetical protein